MGRIWFWAGVIVLALLCRHYSFWAVFGWAYAAASLALVVVCFTYRRRAKREAISGRVIDEPQTVKQVLSSYSVFCGPGSMDSVPSDGKASEP